MTVSLQETKYFSKIVIDQKFNHQITLVAPHWDKIFEDNISKTTLEFENTILLNLLEGFLFKDRSGLLGTIKQTDNDKRTSRVFEVKVDYFVQPILDFSVPEIHSFKGVRKDISRIIKKLNLLPGIYSEREDIIGVVRRFRNEIREDLVSKIALYNQDDLNIKGTIYLFTLTTICSISTISKKGDFQARKSSFLNLIEVSIISSQFILIFFEKFF